MPVYHLKKSDIDTLEEKTFEHQFNKNAIRETRSLSELCGLTSIGIHLVRVKPGMETTEYHMHEYSDEFVYILSGNGSMDLADETVSVSAGDFIGFPMNGPAHIMKNTSDEDLVYLMGGDRPEFDVVNYPRLNRRMYKIRGQKEYVDADTVTKIEQS